MEESINRSDIYLVSEVGRGWIENDTQYRGEATERGNSNIIGIRDYHKTATGIDHYSMVYG